MQTAQQVTVPFQGQFLFVVERDGQPYTPMKPIVEGMGLDWASQLTKLNGNKKRFCIVMSTMQLPGDDQKRDVVCIPLRKLPGWMMTLQPSRVRPEIREKVITYQNECDDVLWDHWMKRAVPPAPTLEDLRPRATERQIQAARENGKKGGRPRKDAFPAQPQLLVTDPRARYAVPLSTADPRTRQFGNDWLTFEKLSDPHHTDPVELLFGKLIADGVDIEGAEVWYAAWKHQAANAFDTLQHISASIADVMRRGPNVLFRYDPDKLTTMDAQAYSNPSIRRMGIIRRAVMKY